MSMSISASGYSSWSVQGQSRQQNRMPPPDPQAELQQAFAAMDTDSKGYLEVADLESALSQSGGDSSTASELFSALDTDTDGKVTEEEMSAVLKNLCGGSDRGQFDMRMAGGQGMAPPPPPPEEGDEAGFTQDQLSQMATELAETDSTRAAEFETLAASFDDADTDGNGTLTRDEAMSFLFGDSESESSEAGTDTSSTVVSTADSDSGTLMQQIMSLVKTYGRVSAETDSATSLLSLQA